MAKKGKSLVKSSSKRILVYCGGDPSSRFSSFFFLNLFWQLMVLGRKRGFEMVSVMDNRLTNMRDNPPKEVTSVLESGEVDGIIGIMLFESMIGWMETSGLPHSVLFEGTQANRVNFDYSQMIDLAFSRFATLGCKSVGLMIPMQIAHSDLLEHMDEVAQRLSLEVNYESILVTRKSQELSGYNHFLSLLEVQKRPDGLVVFPDITACGMVTALVERNIKVPEKMKLILHRNEEAPYSVPVPCDWVENSGVAMAEALIEQLEAQWRTETLKRRRVCFRLIQGL